MIAQFLKFNLLTFGIWNLHNIALNSFKNQAKWLRFRTNSLTHDLITKDHNLDHETVVALCNHESTIVGALSTLLLILSCVLFMPSWSLYLSSMSPLHFRTIQALLSISILSELAQVNNEDNDLLSTLQDPKSLNMLFFSLKFKTFISLISIVGSIIWPQNLTQIYLVNAASRVCIEFARLIICSHFTLTEKITGTLYSGIAALIHPILWQSTLGIRFETAFIFNNTIQLALELFTLTTVLPHLEKYVYQYIKKERPEDNPQPSLSHALFQPLGRLVLMVYDSCISAVNRCFSKRHIHSISHSCQAFVQAQGLRATKSKENKQPLMEYLDLLKEKVYLTDRIALTESIEWSRSILGAHTDYDR